MKTYKIFAAVVALAALNACQNEEMECGGFANDPYAVHIRASIGDMIARSNPVGADATYFNPGDEISIKTGNQSAVVYVLGSDRNTWTPIGSEYLKWNSQYEVFTAVYPASAANGFTLPADQSTVENIALADHMMFYGECSKRDDNSVSLTMKRQTARVVIRNEVNWGDQYKDENGAATHRITELNVHSATKVTPCLHNNNWYALVVPTSKVVIDEPFVSITIEPLDGGTSETLLIKGIPELKAGYSYSYSLNIGKDVVTIGDVTVDEWNTTSPVDGTADEVVDEASATDYTYDEATNTYTVYTAKGLQEVNTIAVTNHQANITLANDIAMPSVADGESNWTPLGASDMYVGTFDGNGKTISGLQINMENRSSVGLIGCLGSGGTVKGLSLRNCTVKGSDTVGGIVGLNSNGTIHGCHTFGCRISSGKYTGGIVGSTYGKVYGCSVNDGYVESPGLVGGIAGYNKNTTYPIAGCLASQVNLYCSNMSTYGGISGDNYGSIVGCYAYLCSVSPSREESSLWNAPSCITYLLRTGCPVTQCYFLGEFFIEDEIAGFDTNSPETTWGDSENGAVKAMNEAIDASSATVRYHWEGTFDGPVLVEVGIREE